MSVKGFIIWMACLCIFLIFTLMNVGEVFKVFCDNPELYAYFLGGCLIMFVVDKYTSTNNQWLKTYHHENTHLLFNLITFRQILMLRVDADGGLVSSMGRSKWMLEAVSLSPYCFPLAAYIVMGFGYLFANDMSSVYALILGIAYFFHLLCIKSDFGEWPLMGRGQPDINQYPLSFSYLYIFSFWLFNTMIVLLSVRSDIVDAYLQMYDSFIGTIVSLF